jgi:hypothetical protein
VVEAPLTPRTIAASCALLSAVLCLWGASGGAGWYDAPELVAASQQLGLAHAPGEVGYLLGARLAQLLPVGDLTFRAVLFSAACVAALVAFTVLVVHEIAPRPVRGPWAPAAVGLLGATCGPLWLHGTVVEVYGLQALLVVLAIWICRRGRGVTGPLLLGGALMGLAATVNPLQTALAVPAIAALVLLPRARPNAFGVLAGTAIAAVTFVALTVYLPVRSSAEPGLVFSRMHDVGDVTNYVTGRDYARSFGAPGPGLIAANLATHVRLLMEWLGIPAAALALGGLFLTLRWRARTGVGLLLLGGAAWLATVPRPALETHAPDLAGYMLLSCVVGLVFAAIAVAAIARRSAPAAAGLLLVAVSVSASSGVELVDRYRGREAEASAVALLEATPPGGAFLAGSDSSALPLLHATTVGRRRPDVAVLPPYRWTSDEIRRACVGRPWIVPPPEDAGLCAEAAIGAWIAANPDLGVAGDVLLWAPHLRWRLWPAGLALVRSSGASGAIPPPLERYSRLDRQLVQPLWRPARLARDRQLRRLLGASASRNAWSLLDHGEPELALQALQDASASHPDPWAMVHLQRASLEAGDLGPRPEPALRSAAWHGVRALHAGRYADACELFEQWLANHPGDPHSWHDLAVASYWAGDLGGASKAWNETLRLLPGHPGALAGRERLYSLGIP